MNLDPELITSCILTGGGAKLPGIAEYIQAQLGFQTRLGYAQAGQVIGEEEVLNDLSYTAAIGLIKYDAASETPSLAGKRSGKRRKGLLEWLKKIF